jgi:hypothetical protein
VSQPVTDFAGAMPEKAGNPSFEKRFPASLIAPFRRRET